MKLLPIARGEVIQHVMAGGGGLGWTFERETERVLRDALDEKVGLQAAREIYGVSIDPETFEINKKETEKIRKTMRKNALKKPPLYTQ